METQKIKIKNEVQHVLVTALASHTLPKKAFSLCFDERPVGQGVRVLIKHVRCIINIPSLVHSH